MMLDQELGRRNDSSATAPTIASCASIILIFRFFYKQDFLDMEELKATDRILMAYLLYQPE